MYEFTFERPASLADAQRAAAAGGAKVLAGGQTLLASMKLRLANPEKLVDLGAIAELTGIRREGNALVIGAMTRHADVAANADVKGHAVGGDIPRLERRRKRFDLTDGCRHRGDHQQEGQAGQYKWVSHGGSPGPTVDRCLARKRVDTSFAPVQSRQ